MTDRDWVDQAACRDEPTDIFFLSRGGDSRPALDICALCPVVAQCLDWGLRHEQHGVFGGTVERERRRMRRARGITCEEPQAAHRHLAERNARLRAEADTEVAS